MMLNLEKQPIQTQIVHQKKKKTPCYPDSDIDLWGQFGLVLSYWPESTYS